MDDFEAHARPVADPEADGLPEVADADSHADSELDRVREADGLDNVALPPDRDAGPLALDDAGSSVGRGTREPLRRRLRRDRPDLGPATAVTDPGPRLADEALDADMAAQVSADAEVFAGPVPARPGSPVSLYDQPVDGVAARPALGRIITPSGGGLEFTDSDAVGYDAGVAGGGFTAEEAAMHEVGADDLDEWVDDDNGDPETLAAARELGPLIRTGAEQPWDPEDLVAAEGRDPTPATIERARRRLAELGPAVIERTVP